MSNNIRQKSRKHGKKPKISFDKEIITKDVAEKLLSNEIKKSELKGNEIQNQSTTTNFKSKKVKNLKQPKTPEYDSLVHTTGLQKSKKNQKLEQNEIKKTEGLVENEETTNEQLQKESIRAQKRKRYAKLIDEKKLKVELELQQKALNYLSKWKYSRSDWKFEKLRQIWLQQNLFDPSKIPSEFWEATVEYFSGSKGRSRQVVLEQAIEMIEKEGNEDENTNEDHQLKLKRVRDIVQHLQ